MARDYRRELADAAQRSDVAELLAIAYQLLGRAESDDERRAFQANKKRKQREDRVSGTSGMSPNVPGRPGTTGDVPAVDPPIRSITTPPPPSAQVIAKLGDVRLQSALDRLRELMADQWEDVAGFLLRRKYVTWQGWVDGMLRDVGMASQFTAADLATVCRDDATLDKRIGSAGVLRTFLGYAKRERMGGGERSPPSGAARAGSISRRDTARVPAGVPAPPSDPDVAPKWQT